MRSNPFARGPRPFISPNGTPAGTPRASAAARPSRMASADAAALSEAAALAADNNAEVCPPIDSCSAPGQIACCRCGKTCRFVGLTL